MIYSIIADKLYADSVQVPNIHSPHGSEGRNICDLVVIHYTGSHGNYASANHWATVKDSKVSWHLTIGRKGSITQLDDFRKIAWHAGKSEWLAPNTKRHYKGINRYGIGIELSNAGRLKMVDGKYVGPHGNIFTPDQVMFDEDGTPWEKFSFLQLKAAWDISLVLCQKYKCVDIVGHNMISPGRKVDPGPMFPMEELRLELRRQPWYSHSKEMR